MEKLRGMEQQSPQVEWSEAFKTIRQMSPVTQGDQLMAMTLVVPHCPSFFDFSICCCRPLLESRWLDGDWIGVLHCTNDWTNCSLCFAMVVFGLL